MCVRCYTGLIRCSGLLAVQDILFGLISGRGVYIILLRTPLADTRDRDSSDSLISLSPEFIFVFECAFEAIRIIYNI